MFSFGKRSRQFIGTLHNDLQKVLYAAIETSKIDFCIICGFRGEKEQNKAFASGNSKLKFPQSKHNQSPSLAFDFAPFFKDNPHIRWEDIESFKKVARHIKTTAKKLEVDIEWGGDWESFKDYPHFELKEKSCSE